MLHVKNFDYSRLRIPVIAVLFGLFALVSWNYMSRFYYVGSYESAVSLSKRPVIIDWDKFSRVDPAKPSEYVIPDTFLNFDSGENGLKKEPNLFPSTYYKSDEGLFPLYMRPKNGGLPLYIIRKFSDWTSPDVARQLYNWLICVAGFAFSCLYIFRKSGATIPFMAFSLITPQIFFLNYANFPSASLTFAISLGILFWIERAEKKFEFFLIGILCSICFFCKLANILTFLPLLLFYWQKVWKNKFLVLAGLIPWIMVILISMDFGHFVTVVLDERKGDVSYVSAVIQGLIQYVSPDLQFRHVMYLMKPASEVIRGSLWWFLISLISSLAFALILFRNCVSKNLGWKIAAILIWQFIIFIKLAPAIKGDLISYFDRALYLAVILLAAHMRKPNKLVTVSFVIFLLFRGGVAFNWNREFNEYTKSLNHCSWVYECMYNDIADKKLIGDKPLVTLNYLDIGQFEFLSGEKLIPLHVNSRLTRTPTGEELIKFFISLPSQEFFILASGGPDGKQLGNYFRPPMSKFILQGFGWKVETVRTYQYPELLKTYSLLKITKS